MEDFSTYTEQDGNAKLTVTSNSATISAGNDNNLYSLYKDKGADFFDELDIDFTIVINNTVQTDSLIGVSLVNTATPSTYAIGVSGNDDCHFVLYWYNALFARLMKGQFLSYDTYNASVGTTYYCTMTRPAGGDTITVEIYSDSGRTTLLDTVAVSGFSGLKWRYIYALSTSKWSENNALNGATSNLEIRTATPPASDSPAFLLAMI